jgi:two-component system sensor histidine kinase HydH
MKLFKEESLFIIALVFLFIFMIGFVVISLNIQGNTTPLLMIKKVSRVIADNLLTYATESTLLNAARLDSGIVSIGLYQEDGRRLYTYGQTPPVVSATGDEFSLIDYERQTIIFILKKAIPAEKIKPAVIYLELDIHEQLQRICLLQSLSMAGPVILVLLMLIFIFLYRRNVKYRKKIVLQEQMAQLGEAARTLSHEIKNPLGAIRLQTAYLRRVAPQQEHKQIGIIEEEVDRLDQLTRKVSDFIRDPLGAPEEIDLVEFIETLTARFHYPVNLEGAAKGAYIIFADRERLRSIFENLLENAADSVQPEAHQDAKTPDGVEPIELAIHSDHDSIIIEIKDRGAGIPATQKEKLFDPFYTTKSRGTGLGLFIARGFTQAAGGSLRLSNRHDGGAMVVITFPIRKKR